MPRKTRGWVCSAGLFRWETRQLSLLSCDDVNVNKTSPELDGTFLNFAVHRDNDTYHTTIGELLTHPDIDVNLADPKYNAPLIHAALYGLDSIIKMLLAHPNIDVNVAGFEGFTALLKAATYGHEEVVKMLLAHPDIKVNTAEKEAGFTALHLAAKKSYCSIIAALLACPEIEINAVDLEGHTPVLWSMKCGCVAVCKLLLSRDDVLVHRPSHYPQSNAGEWSLAAVRLWAMWDEGRIPEFSEAERKELEQYDRHLKALAFPAQKYIHQDFLLGRRHNIDSGP